MRNQWKTLLACGLALSAGMVAPLGEALAQEQWRTRPELEPLARVIAREPIVGADRVIGGIDATEGEFPFQVSLQAANNLSDDPESQVNSHFCGGSLIAPEWVLTAAHCLVIYGQQINPEQVKILVGATDLDKGTRYDVAEIVVHENYNPFVLDTDIGLIRLTTAVNAPTVSLADESPEDGTATVIGWGRTETGAFPRRLLKADISLVPNATCNAGIKDIYAEDTAYVLSRYAGRFRLSKEALTAVGRALTPIMGDPLSDNMICAGVDTGARDACQGDSGGPMFSMGPNGPVQVGIVSWGEGPLDAEMPCGHANAYGVYTKVAKFRDWIADKTGVR